METGGNTPPCVVSPRCPAPGGTLSHDTCPRCWKGWSEVGLQRRREGDRGWMGMKAGERTSGGDPGVVGVRNCHRGEREGEPAK